MMRRVFGLFVVMAAAVTGGCASSGAVPRPFPVPGGSAPQTAAHPAEPPTVLPPSAADPAPATPTRPPADTYALTGTALALRGTPYRNGGTDPGGFDCSGFTQYVFSQHGIALPREVKDQYAAGQAVKPEEVAPGDLLFFTTVAPGASHVGISLGGGEFVHAPSSTGVVRVEHVNTQYWSQRFVGARRIQG
jgi:cell wall-associated NlpC family hydrolase